VIGVAVHVSVARAVFVRVFVGMSGRLRGHRSLPPNGRVVSFETSGARRKLLARAPDATRPRK
jgi:hypothetical protein